MVIFDTVTVGAFGAVNCMVVVPVQLFASVTVIVYTVAAHKLVALPDASIAAPPLMLYA
ncbi:MAG: hypothetical protein IPI22_13005 [Bacteroidetes bacterium]|nr:hypothetical protein [Bacteroidota bacterium]